MAQAHTSDLKSGRLGRSRVPLELAVRYHVDRIVARLEEALRAPLQHILEDLVGEALDEQPRLRHAAPLECDLVLALGLKQPTRRASQW
eukprot:2789461-Prymnesium_polylepis.1